MESQINCVESQTLKSNPAAQPGRILQKLGGRLNLIEAHYNDCWGFPVNSHKTYREKK